MIKFAKVVLGGNCNLFHIFALWFYWAMPWPRCLMLPIMHCLVKTITRILCILGPEPSAGWIFRFQCLPLTSVMKCIDTSEFQMFCCISPFLCFILCTASIFIASNFSINLLPHHLVYNLFPEQQCFMQRGETRGLKTFPNTEISTCVYCFPQQAKLRFLLHLLHRRLHDLEIKS